jgi:hypothetical protein
MSAMVTISKYISGSLISNSVRPTLKEIFRAISSLCGTSSKPILAQPIIDRPLERHFIDLLCLTPILEYRDRLAGVLRGHRVSLEPRMVSQIGPVRSYGIGRAIDDQALQEMRMGGPRSRRSASDAPTSSNPGLKAEGALRSHSAIEHITNCWLKALTVS